MFQGQYQNDLRGLIFDNQTPDLPKIPGEYILEKVFQIDVNRSKWINLSVIFSMIVIYRIIFFIMIKINEDVTPWVRGYLARRRMQQKSGAQNTTIAPDLLTQSPSLRTYVSPPTKWTHQSFTQTINLSLSSRIRYIYIYMSDKILIIFTHSCSLTILWVSYQWLLVYNFRKISIYFFHRCSSSFMFIIYIERYD